MGTKFVLASLATLIIQLLYLQKLFVISWLCIQRVGNTKICYLAMISRKYLLLLQGDLIYMKRTLATFSQYSIFSLTGICALYNHSLLLIAQSQIDFVILSQSIDLQLPILLMQCTAVVLPEINFI